MMYTLAHPVDQALAFLWAVLSVSYAALKNGYGGLIGMSIVVAAFIAGRALISHLYVSSQHDSCCWYSQRNNLLCEHYSSKSRHLFFCHSVLQSWLLYSYHGLILTSALMLLCCKQTR